MRSTLAFAVVAGLAASALGGIAKDSADHACAKVAEAQGTGNTTEVPVDLALSCLKSVPLDTDGGKTQLQGIKTFAQFQSTLAYLKDPPPGYLYPRTDILGGLDQISKHLNDGDYENEYTFQLDIYKLVASAFDGHFQYVADILDVFIWTRDLKLVSVSSNGLSLPNIYVSSDVKQLAASYTDGASPVAKINDQDTETWLNQYATLNSGHEDPDATYNAMFPIVPLESYSLASRGRGYNGTLAASRLYQGAQTVLTFKNGTKLTITNKANTSKDFTGVTDGSSFFDKFCTGSTPDTGLRPGGSTTEAPYEAVPQQTELPAPASYPEPWVIASNYSVGGYLLEDDSKLAVLSVPSFDTNDIIGFQNTVRTFLATCKKHDKKRLIIDLRGNPGGILMLGFDLFKQLFPDRTPYAGTNLQAHPLFDDVGQIVSEQFKDTTTENVGFDGIRSVNYESVFNVKADLTEDNDKFDSWEDFYGPHKHNGGEFTSITRWDLNDRFETVVPLTGYNQLSDIVPEATFDPEDIILLQDGFCSSTCAVFSEFMKTQVKVRQVVFGGRRQLGPMQGVGGVKGATINSFYLLDSRIREAWENATPEQTKHLESSYPQLLEGTEQAILRGKVASVNLRNNIRRGDNDSTPLQFVYEAADCRLFYTAPQLSKQEMVWQAAYQAIWGKGSCVSGSTDHPSSKPDADELAKTPKNADNLFDAETKSPYPSDLELDRTPSSSSTAYSTATPTKSTTNSPTATESSLSVESLVVNRSMFIGALLGLMIL